MSLPNAYPLLHFDGLKKTRIIYLEKGYEVQ